MIPIRINESISMINDRSAAKRYESLTQPYFKKIQALTAIGEPSIVLKRIYLMVVFDPAIPHGSSGIEFDKYSRRAQEAEATVDIRREEAAQLADKELLVLVATRLRSALCLLKERIPDAALEIQELIDLVDQFNRSNVPGYDLLQEKVIEIFSPQESLTAAQASFESKFVIQLPERYFHEYDQMDQLEEDIASALGEGGQIEGNDVGEGKLNIFILGSDTSKVLGLLHPLLVRNPLLAEARVAVAEGGTDDYKIVWPPDVTGSFEL